jgi:hypothetical protein
LWHAMQLNKFQDYTADGQDDTACLW